LALLRDDPDLLGKAADYLDHHASRVIYTDPQQGMLFGE
jgi:hypothetical protein